MSKSLTLRDGDLVTAGRVFETVRGKEKLLQDLTHRIISRIGTDPATPTVGSHYETDTYIGSISSAEIEMQARSELINIIQDYQQEQLAKIKTEIARYGGRHTLDSREVIDTINSVTSARSGDILLLRAELTTLSGENIQVNVPVNI